MVTDLDRLNFIFAAGLWLRYKDSFFKSRSCISASALSRYGEFVQPVCSTIWQLYCREKPAAGASRGSLEGFSHVLDSLLSFADSKVKLDDFLALVLQARFVQLSTVPATVDVVKVQSYDLIEPLAAPYVYAIGLTSRAFSENRKTRVCLVMKIGSAQWRNGFSGGTQIASLWKISRRIAIRLCRWWICHQRAGVSVHASLGQWSRGRHVDLIWRNWRLQPAFCLIRALAAHEKRTKTRCASCHGRRHINTQIWNWTK